MKASRTRQQDRMENFYASLYENNHVVMLLIDPIDGSIVDANPAAESFYGWTRKALKRKNIADINTLASAQIREEMQAAHEARRNHFFFRHRRADGSIRDVEVYGGSIDIQDRRLLYSISFDIAERKRAEAQLYERTAYLENLLNYANTPIIAWDNAHRITKFNPAFERLTGRTFEEVAGQRLDILFPEATKQQSLQYIDRTRKGERWETVEIEIVDVHGTIKTLLWNSASIYAPDGQHITATIAQGYDITERKRAEKKLRLSEERFKTIFEGSRDAIFIADPDQRFIHVNQAACELAGYSITELLSMRIPDLNTAEDVETFKTYFSKVIILLVEDEPAILAVGTKILERQGYTVLAAASPDEAMRLAREHAGDIHLLITDVVMPKMNGRDLARNLLARHPDLKCLFMSGYTANVIAHHGVLDPGVHFMQKPVSIQDLATKVRTALEVSE